MADIVRFGADASDYFNVVDRMRGSLKGLGGDVRNTSSIAAGGFAGGDGGGLMGFLKGERAVKGQAKFLVTSLLEAKDASSAAESALQAFIYSTKVGLGAAVGGAVLFTAFKLIKTEIDGAAEASEKFNNIMSNLAVGGTAGSIGAIFEQATVAFNEFKKHVESTPFKINEKIKGVAKGINMALGEDIEPVVGSKDPQVQKLTMERKLIDVAKEKSQAELDVAVAKAGNIHKTDEQNELDKVAVEYAQKKKDIEAGKGPQAAKDIAIAALDVETGAKQKEIRDKELRRLAESRDFELKTLDDVYQKKEDYEKKFEAALKARAQEVAKAAANEAQAARDVLNLKKSPTDPTGLLADVGKIAQDPQAYQKRLEAQVKQEQAGQALIDAAKAEQARQQAGFAPTITPERAEMYNRILDATKAQEKATSLEALSKMDFSAIAKLGDPKLDFSGIEKLAGLTIIVQ